MKNTQDSDITIEVSVEPTVENVVEKRRISQRTPRWKRANRNRSTFRSATGSYITRY